MNVPSGNQTGQLQIHLKLTFIAGENIYCINGGLSIAMFDGSGWWYREKLRCHGATWIISNAAKKFLLQGMLGSKELQIRDIASNN